MLHLRPNERLDDHPRILRQEDMVFPVPVVSAQWVHDSISRGKIVDWRLYELKAERPESLPTPLTVISASPGKRRSFSQGSSSPTPHKKQKGERKHTPDPTGTVHPGEVHARADDGRIGEGGDDDAGPGPSTSATRGEGKRMTLDHREVESDDHQRDADCRPLDVMSRRSSLGSGPSDPAINAVAEPLPFAPTSPQPEPEWVKPFHRDATFDLIAKLKVMPDSSSASEREFLTRKYGNVRAPSWR